MKTGSYRKIKFTIDQDNENGGFLIQSYYKGKYVKVHTRCYDAWSCLADASDKVKWNKARRFCYDEIIKCYNS